MPKINTHFPPFSRRALRLDFPETRAKMVLGSDTMFDLILRGRTLLDGTGGAPFEADLAVQSGKIAAIGTPAILHGTRSPAHPAPS